MTLEEAIKHAEEVAEEQEKEAKEWHEIQVRKCELIRFAEMDYTHENECKACAEEHRQLAEWLADYQRLLKAINDAKEEINYKSDHSDTGMSCGLLSALVIIDKYVYGVKPILTNGKESE